MFFRKLLLSCLFLGFALLLVCCSNEKSKISTLPTDAKILAFGDSLTYGTGTTVDLSYPSILSKITGFEVLNAGLPGELSSEAVQRLQTILEDRNFHLVVLCHGGNDILLRKTASEIADNLTSMIKLIKENGADIILLGVPQFNITLAPPKLYGEIAIKMQLPYDDEILPDILADKTLRSDYVHPNTAGYRKLAERVAFLIDESQQ